MKKVLSIIGIFVLVLLISGCGSSSSKYLEEISYKELLELV